MSNVNPTAPKGQESVTSALRWSNPEAARAWLAGLQAVLDDALAAAADQLLPLRQRRLGHVEAQRIFLEASAALAKALLFAALGLPPKPDVS
jgi:hypothetical protein